MTTPLFFKTPNHHHRANEWLVQKLAHDFTLIDAWTPPIRFDESKGDSLYLFRKKALQPVLDTILSDASLTGKLFRLRGFLGKISGDNHVVNTLPIPGCSETSLFQRMGQIEKKPHQSKLAFDMQSHINMRFRDVYAYPNEALSELSNSTVHALMHYAWIKDSNKYQVQIGTYVKHRGVRGRVYMKLINPFRHHVVYPYIYKLAYQNWDQFCQSRKVKP